MISLLRKRQIGKISNSSCLVEQLYPRKITLSNLINSSPSLRNSVFLGFAKYGKYVVAINDEGVVLDPYIPFSVQHKPAALSGAMMVHEGNGSLLDKRVLVLVHTESCLVATLLFHDTLDIDRTMCPDVGLRIFDGANLVCERLIHARESRHRIYENYAHSANGQVVFIINGGHQMFFYLVLARETCDDAVPLPCEATNYLHHTSRKFDSSRQGASPNVLQEDFPCRSRWYWNSTASCTCAECSACTDTNRHAPDPQEDSPMSQLCMEAEIDSDLLAMHLLRLSFDGVLGGALEVPGHLLLTEMRILCPHLPESSSELNDVSPTASSPMSPACPSSVSSSFHAVLGLCLPYRGKVLYVVWQLSVAPWTGRVVIDKVEDLVSFCKRMKRPGRVCVLRSAYDTHAEYLSDAVDQYAEHMSRTCNPVAVAMRCNDMCEEFRSPALDGATASVREIKHPVFPISVYNDELLDAAVDA